MRGEGLYQLLALREGIDIYHTRNECCEKALAIKVIRRRLKVFATPPPGDRIAP
jgi:hypothetical protein